MGLLIKGSIVVCALVVVVSIGTSVFLDGRFWEMFARWQLTDMPDLTGKIAIVTGPTIGGIGFESSLEMAKKGAHVVLAGRSKTKGKAALDALKAEIPDAKVEFMELDLGSLSNVKEFAEAFKAKQLPLHILMNNAGVMMNPFALTVDGYESQFATNHLGHHLLTKLLLPELEASAPSRIITVSSGAAFFPERFSKLPKQIWDWSMATDFESIGQGSESAYDPTKAYGRSKLANVLFAKKLDKLLEGKHVYSNACNPGGIKTNLYRHVLVGPLKLLEPIFEIFMDAVMLAPNRGAVTQLYLATSPDIETKNIRGQYWQPQAMFRGEPAMSNDKKLQEELWAVSDRLVAKYL